VSIPEIRGSISPRSAALGCFAPCFVQIPLFTGLREAYSLGMKFLLPAVLLLALASAATAGPIEGSHYYNPPTGGIVNFTTDSIYQGLMREALIIDALLEWDNVVCTERYFFLDYILGTITIKWDDLGAGGTLAQTAANSITVNSNASLHWYEGLGSPGAHEYDLLSVLKHEIGHAIGVSGDWGRLDLDGVGEEYTDSNNNAQWDPGEPYYDTNSNGKYDDDYTPPAYASSDQPMWGFFDEGQTIRNIQYCDATELEGSYSIHIPEPAAFLLVMAGAVPLTWRRVSRR
jgi:hypothetical protein